MKTMMKTALLALLLGFCLNAQAVHVNQQGIGEVLIFPYYTVNNDYNTFYTVINTSDQGKAIKVRFVEGLNHEPVLLTCLLLMFGLAYLAPPPQLYLITPASPAYYTVHQTNHVHRH